MLFFGTNVDLSWDGHGVIITRGCCWPCNARLQVELIHFSDKRVGHMWRYLIGL